MNILSAIMGFFTGSTAAKVTTGANMLGIASMAPLAYWMYDKRMETICFEYQQLFIFALVILGYGYITHRQPGPTQ